MPSSTFHSSHPLIYIQKVFPTKGDPYYYCYVTIDYKKFRETPNAKFHLLLNNKELNITPVENLKYGIKEKTFSGWYIIHDDMDYMLSNLQSIKLDFTDGDNLIKSIEISPTCYPSFAKLSTIKKEDYIREGKVYDTAKEACEEMETPLLFFQNKSTEEIKNIILTKVLQKTIENKEYRNTPFRFWQSNNPLVFSVERKSKHYYGNPFVTFEMHPYHDGTFVRMYKNQRHYDGSYLSKIVDSDNSESAYNYYCNISDEWDNLFFEVYTDLYGQYTCGFDWLEEKSKDGNIFYIKNINSIQFPQLTNIQDNDMIKSIDGIDTTFLRSIELKYRFLSANKPINLVLEDKNGNKKNILIKPIKQKAVDNLFNYSEIMKDIKIYKDDCYMVWEDKNAYLFYPVEPKYELPVNAKTK